MGSAGIPNVARWLTNLDGGGTRRLLARAMGRSVADTVRLPILTDVRGALRPVRVGAGAGRAAPACRRRRGTGGTWADAASPPPCCCPSRPPLQGRTTVLLGAPGSGKSVLMRLLAGHLQPTKALRVRQRMGRRLLRPAAQQMPGRTCMCSWSPACRASPRPHRPVAPLPPPQISGKVRYNGRGAAEFDLRRSGAYVDQYDVHIPTLTVRETLWFALRSLRSGGAANNVAAVTAAVVPALAARAAELGADALPPDVQQRILARLRTPELAIQVALELLGLEGCADTLVGSSMARGISGGQMRRLTCGELMVGGRRLLFLDDLSRGEWGAEHLKGGSALGPRGRVCRDRQSC